ncbi:MAG: PilZ domain-containing protein [Myxococcales bacterium]|nr:PilZ domain-containing protein [Myxococcales bacterium]
MSATRRQSSRTKKRLTVRYGTEDLELASHTKDISTGGIFIVARTLIDIGTQIHLRILWSTGFFYGEGMVVRHHKIHHELQRIEDQGMGIRFMPPAEVVERVVPRHLREGGHLVLDCTSKAQVAHFIDSQLRHGVLYVPIGDPSPSMHQQVRFDIVLVFRKTQDRLVGEGEVIQLLEPDGTKRRDRSGAVVQVVSPEMLINRLKELLDV